MKRDSHRQLQLAICQCLGRICEENPSPSEYWYEIKSFAHFLWTVGLANRTVHRRERKTTKWFRRKKEFQDIQTQQDSLPEMVDAGLLTRDSAGSITGTYIPLSADGFETAFRPDFWNNALSHRKKLFSRLMSYLCQHGLGEKLPVERGQCFDVDSPDLRNLLTAMVAEKYATRSDDGFTWTDKMDLVFADAHLLRPEDIGVNASLRNLDQEVESLKAISDKIPFSLTNNIKTRTAWGLAVAVRGLWDGKVWHKEPLDIPVYRLEAACAIADEFTTRFVYTRQGWQHRQSKPLSDPKKAFLTGIAKGLHHIYVTPPHAPQDNPEREIHNMGQRALYEGLKFLWQCGLAHAHHKDFPARVDYESFQARYENGQRYSFISLSFTAIPYEDIDRSIRFDALEAPQLSPPDPVTSFIDVANHSGAVPTGYQESFTVSQPALVEAMEEFCAHDYAIKDDIYYRWSDRIAPHMLESYIWRIEQADLDKADWGIVRSTIEKFNTEERNFTVPELMRYWNGETFQDEPLARPVLRYETTCAILLVMAGSIEPR